MRRNGWVRLAAMGVALAAAFARADAQTCDDALACTSNDMCVEGNCTGTPVSSGACDDANDCTVNDTCVGGTCLGEPAPLDTPCGTGCGTCRPIVDVPGAPLTCKGNPADNGKPCDPGFGSCFVGTCLALPEVAFCQPAPLQCPDTDGNPCTDGCNALTERCERDVPKCFPVCETCNPGSGACEPANIGAACDDFNPCSPQSRCDVFDPSAAGGFGARGLCLPGAPNAQTPTRTATVALPTATAPTATSTATAPAATSTVTAPAATATATVPAATSTATRTNTPAVPATATVTRTMGTPPTPARCTGDCNGDSEVVVNEVVTGVTIALGNALISACPSFDSNASTTVEVNELITGVNNLLAGCPA